MFRFDDRTTRPRQRPTLAADTDTIHVDSRVHEARRLSHIDGGTAGPNECACGVASCSSPRCRRQGAKPIKVAGVPPHLRRQAREYMPPAPVRASRGSICVCSLSRARARSLSPSLFPSLSSLSLSHQLVHLALSLARSLCEIAPPHHPLHPLHRACHPAPPALRANKIVRRASNARAGRRSTPYPAARLASRPRCPGPRTHARPHGWRHPRCSRTRSIQPTPA